MLKKLFSLFLCVVVLVGLIALPVSADVGDYEISEREPNDSMSAADRIYDDYTVSGRISGSDGDFFKFSLYSTYSVSVVCVADYSSLIYGILDSTGEAIAACGDGTYTSSGLYSFTLSTTLYSGTYYLFIGDSYDNYNDYMFYFKTSSSSSTTHTHSYTSNCDTTCNSCGATRTTSTSHIYSNSCDGTCNSCGASRTVPHAFTSSCDTTCSGCGATRSTYYLHGYSGDCDTTCEYCDATRTTSTSHSYTNGCDASCDVCGATRSVSHTYSSACDATCNTCGATRTVTHTFSNNSDTTCNVCGATSAYPGGDTLIYENGKWYHIKDRKKVADTTLVNWNNKWWYVKDGVVNQSNTLCNWNGKWWHVKNGNVAYDTTLVNFAGSWYYVKNGVVDFSATTLVYFGSNWYYVKAGKVDYSNTLCNWNGKWWHVKNGTVVKDTTLVSFAGSWYYVKNGVVDFSTTTLVYFGSNWYYVKAGKVDYSNTLCNWNGKWWHVKDGKVVSDTTLVYFASNWYYVKNGVVNYSNTLCNWNGKWYHVKNGTVVKDTTLVNFASKWYYVKDGVVNYSDTLCYFSGNWYHVKDGNVVYDTTLVNYAGNWYYIKNGIKATNFSGSVKYQGVTFYVKNGTATIDPNHTCTYAAATCTTPKTCTLCKKTSGSALGHTKTPNTCNRCGAATEAFETLTFSGTGYRMITGINIPEGRYIISGVGTSTNGSAGSFYTYLYNENGGKEASMIEAVYSYNQTVKQAESFEGAINGGMLEIDADSNVTWTITIYAPTIDTSLYTGTTSSSSFKTITLSGTGYKMISNIKIPSGRYIISGVGTSTDGRAGSFYTYLYNENGGKEASMIEAVFSYEQTVRQSESFTGPINGGMLEINADDNVSWTITITAP